jgi:putative hydrolase of the HAD superfamily
VKVSWILFDAGNTLIHLNYSKVIAALGQAGLRVDEPALRRAEAGARRDLDAAILAAWGAGVPPRTGWIEARVWKEFWARAVALCGAAPGETVRLAGQILEVTRPAASWDQVDPSTPQVLDDLRAAGYRLGVISNSNGTVAGQLEALGLASRMEFVIDSADVGVEKPHPAIFHHALARAGGVAPDQALYVGDVYAIDVLGAAGAGMRAVLFDPMDQWSEDAGHSEAQSPCATVRSLDQVQALLES